MTIKNTENSYGLVTKLLHWIVGVMIVSMIIYVIYRHSYNKDVSSSVI